MSGQDRRDRRYERPNSRIFVIWLVLGAIFLAIGLPRIQQGQFPDPDDALRLVQVRDLLGGQSWFDLHQYRINAPDGSLMHWSRLVDIPLALVIMLLTPLLGPAGAESTALIIVPMLTLGLILFLIGRLAWRLFDNEVAGLACLCIGLLTPLVFQLQPMRIDHHGWQIFTVALALWGIAHRSAFKGGAIAGLAMAAGATISIEILPMVAAFGGILAMRWFRDHSQRWWLVAYMQALALSLVALFFATRGIGDLAQHCDVLSPAHLGFFVLTAVGTGAIATARHLPRVLLFLAFAGVGATGLLFFGLSSPTCLMTPFAALDPLVRDYWYVHVLEGRPLWEQDMAEAVPVALQLAIGLLAAIMLMGRSRDWLRQWWSEYALLLGASIVLSLFVWRSAAFAAVLAAIPLGWLASRLLKRVGTGAHIGAKLLAVLATIVLLLPATPLKLWAMAVPADTQDEPVLVRESACQIRDSAVALNGLKAGTIFAPLDIGPSILLKSNHAVIATGHHRAEAAMRDVILAFISEPDAARVIMQRHGADYVAICSDLVEINMLADAKPESMAAQLVAGDQPAWLRPVDLSGTPDEFRVWRVVETSPE